MTATPPRVIMYLHPLIGSGCLTGDPRTLAELRTEGRLSTKHGRPVCRRCGAELIAGAYTFAVVEWRGDGRYSISDALATYARRGTATNNANRRGPAYVVRTLSIPAA